MAALITNSRPKKQNIIESGIILPENANGEKNKILLPDSLGNLKYIFEDILAGDPDALKRPEFTALNFNNIKAALKWLSDTNSISDSFKETLLREGWRLNFKCKPPTPEEFLTEKFLGPLAENIFEPIRNAFIEFMDPTKPYRTAVLSLHIGFGKSFLSALIQLYISVHYAYMWHPWKFFGQAQPMDSLIKMKNGSYKRMSEIKLGDELYSIGCSESIVLAIMPQGRIEQIEVEFYSGSKIRCSPQHLWTVYDNTYKDYRILETSTILANINNFGFPEEEEVKRDYNKIILAEKSYIQTLI